MLGFVDAVPSEVFDYEQQHKFGATATLRKIIEVQPQCGLGMRIVASESAANSKLLLERNLLEGRLVKTGAYRG
jgi:hypothetical protein